MPGQVPRVRAPASKISFVRGPAVEYVAPRHATRVGATLQACNMPQIGQTPPRWFATGPAGARIVGAEGARPDTGRSGITAALAERLGCASGSATRTRKNCRTRQKRAQMRGWQQKMEKTDGLATLRRYVLVTTRGAAMRRMTAPASEEHRNRGHGARDSERRIASAVAGTGRVTHPSHPRGETGARRSRRDLSSRIGYRVAARFKWAGAGSYARFPPPRRVLRSRARNGTGNSRSWRRPGRR